MVDEVFHMVCMILLGVVQFFLIVQFLNWYDVQHGELVFNISLSYDPGYKIEVICIPLPAKDVPCIFAYIDITDCR